MGRSDRKDQTGRIRRGGRTRGGRIRGVGQGGQTGEVGGLDMTGTGSDMVGTGQT